MPNSLTRQAGLKLGPVILETLVKHYFERVKKDAEYEKVHLRQDELLYDEAFNIVKTFLEVATYHTVEEVQNFANTRTPSPPWVHVVRLVIPMSCCDDAASYLIKALGGEEFCKRTVGGTKWWQVRGVNGVDAQWITAEKDWRQEKKRHKAWQEKMDSEKNDSGVAGDANDNGVYDEEMDSMRCIIYAHGGGYYFGSVDQERYSIQRHARKINGRVFAVNYRLSPQYPFPCPIQDLLAAYLFLIRPPHGAAHRPVNPAHIVVAGDSAGGGLSLAFLQVVRDSGLPMPAGGVLISPWCDLTHSFPSIHTNTATDVIPPYGLSMQKPSTLWPPPPDEMATRVQSTLRSRIRDFVKPIATELLVNPTATVKGKAKADSRVSLTEEATKSAPSGVPIDVGATTPLPPAYFNKQIITLTTETGEVLTIDHQVHLYTQNSLLAHPLISPALSYLGGLPPLLFIASDKEVLRDEIIYTAHKAAYPERFGVNENARKLYPALEGIESRGLDAAQVHLQVYDDTAHVLPVLFSFTTPGKYCYRAIASFCKHVTHMLPMPMTPIDMDSPILPNGFMTSSPDRKSSSVVELVSPVNKDTPPSSFPRSASVTDVSKIMPQSSRVRMSTMDAPSSFRPSRVTMGRSFSLFSRAASVMLNNGQDMRRSESTGISSSSSHPVTDGLPSRGDSDDVGGPRFDFNFNHSPKKTSDGVRHAGEAIVYSESTEFPSMKTSMIRERVSTRGVVRPLEPESELEALQMPSNAIGVISELSMRRYTDGRSKFDKKFSHATHRVEKHRRRNLELAKRDTLKNMTQLHGSSSEKGSPQSMKGDTKRGIVDGLRAASGSWSWAWALDGDERPPPSSIVSRRDTEEARRLARIADQTFLEEDHHMTGNNLWSVVVNFLTITPDKHKWAHGAAPEDGKARQEKRRSKFARLLSEHRGKRVPSGKIEQAV